MNPARTMKPLIILPAVDIWQGAAVQLVQGEAGSQKVFGAPTDMARRWQEAGATWLHLVDLDAAFGRGSNAAVIAQIVSSCDLQVEVTGGIRDDESLDRALATGCARVNIGTAAVENPAWCDRVIAEHGDRVAVALDVRGEQLATRGWTQAQGSLWDVIERLNQAGCARLVVTDTAVDGTLTGVNVALLEAVCARTDAAVVASGGIASLNDIEALAALTPVGVEGAIVGTALYLGNFTVSQAQAVAASARLTR
ncbi:MAG: bifunctional 1-(5-phosphoribosyl)-5-((5-phosphoribosylamino)methylideneamino)imidazole-4-carboxamide isomerase/phosphoribosylanthranilate isomerase PriA [Propionibacteriaceae bacterium]|jgi:phosphoribosylanthranilate isomerase|nr:bifunctional 1-(5-phosphoribosyl)-5-((5-phosphoribosylamino)methylideneamino)imidazole-4-carboxamide isomerase/phosphoribosylanthranilate isomerase PriA [Propionibacteriaceae bacterium]